MVALHIGASAALLLYAIITIVMEHPRWWMLLIVLAVMTGLTIAVIVQEYHAPRSPSPRDGPGRG